MAVAVGFEPTEACTSHAFEACSFGRSDTPPPKTLPQLWEVLFAVLPVPGAALLLAAQLDPADLAGDCLGQLGELQPADPLVRGELLTGVAQDGQRGVPVRRVPAGQHDICLGHRQPDRV